jgi:hypothetical protein
VIIRQKKRWCELCHQNVFALGHEHGQAVMPTLDVAFAVGRAEHGLMLAGQIRRVTRMFEQMAGVAMPGRPVPVSDADAAAIGESLAVKDPPGVDWGASITIDPALLRK